MWVIEAQKPLKEGIEKGDYKRLCLRTSKVVGVVNKRSCGKLFGAIFTCNRRAVYCDLAQSMDGFLQTFRRFSSIRGFQLMFDRSAGHNLMQLTTQRRGKWFRSRNIKRIWLKV